MQVNLNIRPDIQVETGPRPPTQRIEDKPEDVATFTQSAAVERALKDQPESRTDAIRRGEAMVGSPKYPPLEGIKRISRLLAANWPTALD